MVSGLSRPQRLLSIAVIGGVSLFAVTVYIIFRRKFKNKEANVEDMPELPKTNQVESEPIPDSDVVAADCSKDIDEASEASPSQIEAEEPSPRIQDLELKTEVADLKTEASISEKPSLTMQTLAEMQPIPDWAECSAEIEPIPPSPTVEKSDISTVQNQSVVTNNTAEPSNIATIQDQPVETVSNRNAETIEPIVEKCENQVNKKSEAGVSSEVTTSKKSQAASKRTDRVSNNEKMPRNEEYRMHNGNHSAIFDSDQTVLPIYEFEVPNTLVGLIIGIRGKTIKELCTRADVRILIRPHHDPSKVTTHQICSIEGRRDDINKCLHMMRHRFPPNRFPDLNLKPVFPPPAPTPVYTSPDMMELALPVGAMFEVYISAPIDSGHFFVQLPTHPTFPSLRHVDELMNRIYNHSLELPDYVRPPKHAKNMLCAAPASNGWFRAVAVCYDEKQDEMLVKFVDYGGFARIPRADLRFLLRQDLLSLPFQSIECHIADVEPISGNWSEEANTYFQKLCTGKIINCELVGHSRKDGFPVVRLYVKNTKNEWVPFYKLLVKHRMAKPWDPNSYIPLQLPKITITKEHHDSDVDSVHSDTTLVSPEPSEEAKKENNVQKTDSYNHFNGAAAKNKNHQFGKKGGKSQKRDVTAAYR